MYKFSPVSYTHLDVYKRQHVSTDYLLMGKNHDMVDSRTKLLDVVTQLTEIAKSL